MEGSMEQSTTFYLKNVRLLVDGAFRPLDAVVENGKITGLSSSYANDSDLPEWNAHGMRVLPVPL